MGEPPNLRALQVATKQLPTAKRESDISSPVPRQHSVRSNCPQPPDRAVGAR